MYCTLYKTPPLYIIAESFHCKAHISIAVNVTTSLHHSCGGLSRGRWSPATSDPTVQSCKPTLTNNCGISKATEKHTMYVHT